MAPTGKCMHPGSLASERRCLHSDAGCEPLNSASSPPHSGAAQQRRKSRRFWHARPTLATRPLPRPLALREFAARSLPPGDGSYRVPVGCQSEAPLGCFDHLVAIVATFGTARGGQSGDSLAVATVKVQRDCGTLASSQPQAGHTSYRRRTGLFDTNPVAYRRPP